MEDALLLDLFDSLSREIGSVSREVGSLSREIGDVRVEMKEGFDRLERSQSKTEATLRGAIALAVRDARRQRKRNAEFDQRHLEYETRHIEAQEQMQELRVMMKAFLERSGNGNH